MTQPLRILMLTSVYPRWENDPTPTFVQNLAKDLVKRGHHIRILAPHSKGATRREDRGNISIRRYRYAAPSGVQSLCYEGGILVRLRQKKWRTLLLLPFAICQYFAFKRELSQFRPHIVHAHSIIPQGWIAAKAMRKKSDGLQLIISSHGNDVFGLQGRFENLKTYACERSASIVVNSQATKKAVLSLCSSANTDYIPASPNESEETLTVETRRLLEEKQDKQFIFFAGRLIPEKGIDFLLDLFPRILERHPSVKLFICGSGPLESLVRDRIAAFHSKDAAKYLGWIPSERIVPYFSTADLVVVPSQVQATGWKEAQGLVAVEAMAAGVPVVASRLGGLAESIADGESGFLVEPGNANEWVNTISHVLEASSEQRRRWGDAGKQRYQERFSREATLEKTLALYHRLERSRETT